MISSSDIRAALGTFSEAEAQLLDAAAWAYQGGEIDEDTLSLYVAPAFLEKRMQQPGGWAHLIEDFRLLETATEYSREFFLIGNALRLSASILDRYPDQLTVQLLARLPLNTDGWIDQLRANLLAESPEAIHPIHTAMMSAEHGYLMQQLASEACIAMECTTDESLVAVLTKNGDLLLVEPQAGKLAPVAEFHFPDAEFLSFSPFGRKLFIGANTGHIWTINTASRTVVGHQKSLEQLTSMTCLDEDRLLVGHDRHISILATSDGRELARVGASEGLTLCERAAVLGSGEILIGGLDGRIDVWSTEDGRFKRRLGWFGPYQEDWSSPDHLLAKTFLVGEIWADHGTDIRRLDTTSILNGMPGVSADMWDATIRQLSAATHVHAVTALAVSRDGQIVAASSHNGEIKVWDAANGKQQGWWQATGGEVADIAIDENSQGIFLANESRVLVWDRAMLAISAELPATGAKRVRLRHLARSRLLLGAGEDGTVAVWDTTVKWPVHAPQAISDPLAGLSGICENGAVSAFTESGRIEQRHLWSGSCLGEHAPVPGAAGRAVLSPCGRRLAVPTSTGIVVLDVASGFQMFRHASDSSNIQEQAGSMAISEDGTSLVLASSTGAMESLMSGSTCLWHIHMPSGQTTALSGNFGLVTALSVSADARHAVVTQRLSLPAGKVFGIEQRTTVWRLSEQPPSSFDIAPGKRVQGHVFRRHTDALFWFDDENLYEQDLANACTAEVRLALKGCHAIALSDDECTLASLLGDGSLELWDLEGGTRLATFTADRALASAVVLVGQKVVAALDIEGRLYLLNIPFASSTAPALDFQPAPGSLAACLDAMPGFVTPEAARETLTIVEQLAAELDHSVNLYMSLARQLRDTGRKDSAIAVLVREVFRASGSDQDALLDMLFECKAHEAVAAVLGTATACHGNWIENPALPSRAARWLIDEGERRRVEAIAAGPGPDLARLIAAQELADKDEPAAARYLSALAFDARASDVIRTVALASLRAVETPATWLDAIREADLKQCTLSRRHDIGREILLTLGPLPTLLPHGPAAPTTLVPLRRAMEWNNEAMSLFAQKDLEGAYAAATHAIRRGPHAARYYHTRGLVSLGKARQEQLRLNRSMHEDPGRTDFLRAEQDLTSAIDIDRLFDSAWSQRGYARLELGHYALALQDINESIQMSGTPHPADLDNRAACLRQLGRQEEADADMRRAEQIRESSGGDDALVPGHTRIGDDPAISDEDMRVFQAAAREALVHLGLYDQVTAGFVDALQCAQPVSFISNTVHVLAGFQAWPVLKELSQSQQATLPARIAAAGMLLRHKYDTRIREWLVSLAEKPAVPLESRREAAMALATTTPHKDALSMLRRIPDIDHTQDPPAPGTFLAVEVLRELHRRGCPLESLVQLARERSAVNPMMRLLGRHGTAPALREIVSEVIGTLYDAAIGLELLKELSSQLPAQHGLQTVIRNALDHFSAPIPASEENLRPEQIAYQAFMDARTLDEVMTLAEQYRIFRDPDFVDQVTSLVARLPANERSSFEYKLAALRSLPPDKELVGFRAFARAGSLEDMRKVVVSYPFLTLPSYHTRIEEIIRDTVDPDDSPAFHRRLGWLRQIPPNEVQAALQAFTDAETEAELRKAVRTYPALSNPNIPRLVENLLGKHENWPQYASRLQLLATMVPADKVDDSIGMVLDYLGNDNMDQANRILADMPDGPVQDIMRAAVLLSANRNEEALDILNRAIERHPHPLAFEFRGKACFRLNRLPAALADFSAAIETGKARYEVWLGRGLVNAALHNTQQAISDFNKAETLDQSDVLLYMARAAQYIATARIDDAIKDLRNAVKLAPDSATPRIMLAELLLDGPFRDEAKRHLDIAKTLATPAEHEQMTGLVPENLPVQGVSRNALCPCGSGRRFKHCHGALT